MENCVLYTLFLGLVKLKLFKEKIRAAFRGKTTNQFELFGPNQLDKIFVLLAFVKGLIVWGVFAQLPRAFIFVFAPKIIVELS